MINWTDFGKTLSEADAETLRELVDWWRKQRNRGVLSEQEPTPQAPDVYIAKTPTAGIPAKTAEAGTGTDSSIADVNYADCALYRIDHKSESDIEVEPLGVTKPVYNLGSDVIPGDTLILAVRDKPGKFVAVDLAGGSGPDCIYIKLTGEGTSNGGYWGFYAWNEVEDAGNGEWQDKVGGMEGTITFEPARDTSGKEGVPLGIVVRACRGSSTTIGTGTQVNEPVWYFTTPDLDADIICEETNAGGTVGTGSASCIDSSGGAHGIPGDWAAAHVTKYNPGQDIWHRKGPCFLKHANGLELIAGVRYHGHLAGLSVCGDWVYTTTDCCHIPGSGDQGGGGDGGGGTGPGTGTGTDLLVPEPEDVLIVPGDTPLGFQQGCGEWCSGVLVIGPGGALTPFPSDWLVESVFAMGHNNAGTFLTWQATKEPGTIGTHDGPGWYGLIDLNTAPIFGACNGLLYVHFFIEESILGGKCNLYASHDGVTYYSVEVNKTTQCLWSEQRGFYIFYSAETSAGGGFQAAYPSCSLIDDTYPVSMFVEALPPS